MDETKDTDRATEAASGREVPTPDLSQRRCVPCRGGIPPLNPSLARELARQVPGWKLDEAGDRLRRRFAFRNFAAAMEFVDKVAKLAEDEGHHPDIAIHYDKVDLMLWTHKIGGLHENDFVMAAKIDAVMGPGVVYCGRLNPGIG